MDNRERERVRKTIIKYTSLFEQNLRATVDLHRPKVYSYAEVMAIAIDQRVTQRTTTISPQRRC
jgi:hypothetical protein